MYGSDIYTYFTLFTYLFIDAYEIFRMMLRWTIFKAWLD